jgi:hypothetical protein
LLAELTGSTDFAQHVLYSKFTGSLSVQASGILIHPAETPKIYNFYKVIQKQIFNVHMFTHHTIVLKAATSSTAHVLPHAGTITAEAGSSVITLQYMNPDSFIHQFTVLPRKVLT